MINDYHLKTNPNPQQNTENIVENKLGTKNKNSKSGSILNTLRKSKKIS